MNTAGPADAAYQGDPGAYSEQACWALLGPEARLLPCRTLVVMFDAVADGHARRAVLPIENSLAGTVPRAYELLLERELFATAETRVHIDHVLIGRPGVSLDRVSRVLSHPVALDQCRRFIAERRLEAVPAFDTAGAVALALEDPSGATAAIASRRAASLNGADVLAEDIQDHAENWTRFLLIGPEAAANVRPGGHAIFAFRLPHEPGSLANVLARIAIRRASLTKIESRPIEGRPFEYAFFIELQLAAEDDALSGLVAELRSVTTDLRLLGAY
jgi:prephenate dehydratase